MAAFAETLVIFSSYHLNTCRSMGCGKRDRQMTLTIADARLARQCWGRLAREQ
jgi:hypothetical protein